MRPDPLVLKDALKKFSHDQDKIITPAETIRRFKDRLATTDLQLRFKYDIDNNRYGCPFSIRWFSN